MTEAIITLRQQGKSYSAISREIDVSRATVARYCIANGIAVEVSAATMLSNRIKADKRVLARNFDRICLCANCGKVYANTRGLEEGNQYCSRECSFNDACGQAVIEKVNGVLEGTSSTVYFNSCRFCGKKFAGRYKRGHCGNDCYYGERKELGLANTYVSIAKETECIHCGYMFMQDHGGQAICSRECKNKRAYEQAKETGSKKAAKQRRRQ